MGTNERPTVDQLCELHLQIKAGRVTSLNFQLFLENPNRFVEEVQAAITGGEAASVAPVIQVAPVITGGEAASVAPVIQAGIWTRSLSDAQVLEFYADRKDQKTGMTVAELLPRVREMFTAQDNSYTGPVVVHRRAGYTLKVGAAQEGPCCDDFTHMQDWEFPDAAEPEVLIFGAPIVVKSLFNKNYTDGHKEMRRLEKKFGLPDGFLSFGTVQDFSALMFAGLRDQRICVGGDSEMYFRTETHLASGKRLHFYWLQGSLVCSTWEDDSFASNLVCGLVQGVVVL